MLMLTWEILERMAYVQANRLIHAGTIFGLEPADLVQDALTYLYVHGEAGEDGSDQPTTFIRRTLRFKMIESIRHWMKSRYGQEQVNPKYTGELLEQTKAHPSYENTEYTAVGQAMIDGMLAQLPEREREMTRLYMTGYSTEEISRRYGLSPRHTSQMVMDGRRIMARWYLDLPTVS